jgi:hypothetical protein
MLLSILKTPKDLKLSNMIQRTNTQSIYFPFFHIYSLYTHVFVYNRSIIIKLYVYYIISFVHANTYKLEKLVSIHKLLYLTNKICLS